MASISHTMKKDKGFYFSDPSHPEVGSCAVLGANGSQPLVAWGASISKVLRTVKEHVGQEVRLVDPQSPFTTGDFKYGGRYFVLTGPIKLVLQQLWDFRTKMFWQRDGARGTGAHQTHVLLFRPYVKSFDDPLCAFAAALAHDHVISSLKVAAAAAAMARDLMTKWTQPIEVWIGASGIPGPDQATKSLITMNNIEPKGSAGFSYVSAGDVGNAIGLYLGLHGLPRYKNLWEGSPPTHTYDPGTQLFDKDSRTTGIMARLERWGFLELLKVIWGEKDDLTSVTPLVAPLVAASLIQELLQSGGDDPKELDTTVTLADVGTQ